MYLSKHKWLLSLMLLGAFTLNCNVGSAPIDDNDVDIVSEPPDINLSNVVFDESTIETISLTIESTVYEELKSNALLEEYVVGDVDHLGKSVSNVGIRYKGGYGSLHYCFDDNGQRNENCNKLSIKLKFNEYVKGQRFYGLKRLNLHAMALDGSMMRESLIYKLYRDHGVFAPRTSYVRLVVNDEDMGLYLAVEQIDGRFTQSRFEDGGKGNLYKNIWPVLTETAEYVQGLKTNEDVADVEKMVRFGKSIEGLDSEAIIESLEQWTDMTQLISYLSVTRLVEQWDGLLGWYCGGGGCNSANYYLYENKDDDRFTIIPWDYNNAMWYDHPMRDAGAAPWSNPNPSCDLIESKHGPVRAPSCDPLLQALSAERWDEYVLRSEELMAGAFSQSSIDARIDELVTLIRPEVESDPTYEENWDGFHIGNIKELAEEKRLRVVSDIENR